MKKSLIALAVLASSGAVMAQSSVTIYGLVDAYVGRTTTETTGAAPVAKQSQTVVNSSGANNSRWGLRGTEDLGNGLKANFVLESGFNTDDGTQTLGAQFGRQALVGLSGDFGSVSLGRQYSAYDNLRAATNNLYDTNMATTNTVWRNGVADYTNRVSNSIAYVSPVISGFSGAVVLGVGEDKTSALKATKNQSLHIKYANGPVLVGYAHQTENARLGAANTPDRKYNLFAGSYDFGVAKLTAGYNQAKQAAVEDKEFQMGVSVPFGAASVAAGYSRSKSTALNTNNVGSGFSLLGTYSLSKRTTLYAGYMTTKVETGVTTAESRAKTAAAGLGVRHTF